MKPVIGVSLYTECVFDELTEIIGIWRSGYRYNGKLVYVHIGK